MRDNTKTRLSELSEDEGQKATNMFDTAQELVTDIREQLEVDLYNLGLTELVAERISYKILRPTKSEGDATSRAEWYKYGT